MWSVDKWLDEADYDQDQVKRALTMREKTLRIVEEKDAEIERLNKEHTDYVEDVTAILSEKNIEVERLMREKNALECIVATARNQGRDKAITEFAERLKVHCADNRYWCELIDQIAEEMKGEQNNG